MGADAVTPEDTVRAFFDAYSEGRPERFDEIVSPDYVDYGHTPPGRGPQGARDDYEHAVQLTGGVPVYHIDALVARDDTVAAAWAGHLANGSDYRGLSLYRVAAGRITETRHALIGPLPT
jgi:ketosteroid isomerase-like protein